MREKTKPGRHLKDYLFYVSYRIDKTKDFVFFFCYIEELFLLLLVLDLYKVSL